MKKTDQIQYLHLRRQPPESHSDSSATVAMHTRLRGLQSLDTFHTNRVGCDATHINDQLGCQLAIRSSLLPQVQQQLC